MHIGMLIQECPYYICKIMCSKKEKQKLLIIYEGAAYSSHNGTLAFISSLTVHSSSKRVKDYFTKKYLRNKPQHNLITLS